jgi:hypothetical protein
MCNTITQCSLNTIKPDTHNWTCIPNNLCGNSWTCILSNWAGISGYDVIDGMTSLAASLWTLYGGGGGLPTNSLALKQFLYEYKFRYIFIENITLLILYIINILCIINMYSNGISTNGTRSPMQGANPEAAKYVHSLNINTHIHKIQICRRGSITWQASWNRRIEMFWIYRKEFWVWEKDFD